MINFSSTKWVSTLWDLLQGVALLTLAVILIFNPLGSLGSMIAAVGFFILIVSLIEILVALKKNAKVQVFLAVVEGLLGIFLISNSLLSLRLLSIFLGMFILLSGLIVLIVYNFRSDKEALDHDNPHVSKKSIVRVVPPAALILLGLSLILLPSLSLILLSYILAGSLLVLGFNKVTMLF